MQLETEVFPTVIEYEVFEIDAVAQLLNWVDGVAIGFKS